MGKLISNEGLTMLIDQLIAPPPLDLMELKQNKTNRLTPNDNKIVARLMQSYVNGRKTVSCLTPGLT